MKRTKRNKIASTILCSDIHLSEGIPVCRTDNYSERQWIKVDFISELQKQLDCPVLHAGDLFDHWKPSPYLLRKAILHLPNNFYTVYGQHDLPQHNLKLVNKCGINVLEAAKKLELLGAFSASAGSHSSTEIVGIHWGQKPPIFENDGGRKVLVWHHLTYISKPFPGATGGMAQGILRKYPQFDLILTGDNHESFVEEYKGRLLVNPGSMMRMDAGQTNHKPCVYIWYAEDNSIEVKYLPYEDGVISREHIEKKKKRDARLNSFISKLSGDWKASMSFVKNLQYFDKVNKVDSEVMKIIYKSIENQKR